MKTTNKNLIIALVIIAIAISAFVVFKPHKAVAPVVENTQQEQIPKEGILGNKDDLISFSIWPNTEVSGIRSFRGTIQGGYFFEGNILINVLDANKNIIKKSNAVAKTDWMTSGPVDFEGNIDFTGLPNGRAYIEIHNDNPSDIRANDKSVLIPVIIKN